MITYKEITNIKGKVRNKIYIKYLERVIKILLRGETTLKNSNVRGIKD